MTVEGLESPRYAAVEGTHPVRPVVGRCHLIGCIADESGRCVYCSRCTRCGREVVDDTHDDPETGELICGGCCGCGGAA